MNSYIYNKRKQEKVMSICSILFWILNFVFLQLSVNMFIKIIYSGNSNWFEEAAQKEALNDEFFLNRTKLIMDTVIIILAAVVLFSIVTVILFRKIQLKNMLTQMGVYTVIGYSRKKILGITLLDVVADIIIAFPVSVVLSVIVWMKLSKEEMISALLTVMGNKWWMDIISYIICVAIVMMVIIIYSIIFIYKSTKKGISYMLGKGIV